MENLNSKVMIEEEYINNLSKIKTIFYEILDVCNNKFTLGTGSYLFDGNNYEFCEKMFEKQVLLYEKVKNVNSICEIGTYMGHSILIMLISNPKLKITCIDIDDTFSLPVINYLNKKFDTNINFIKGNSLDVLPNLKEKFDLFHIDGTHKLDFVTKEFEMCKNLTSSNEMNVIFDDYETITGIEKTILKQSIILEQITPDCAWKNSYLKIKL